MEPVQGEAGFVIPPKEFVQAVSNFCKQHGILLVVDEIQTGFGRTGKLFAIEHFDVIPDLMTVSKRKHRKLSTMRMKMIYYCSLPG